VSDSEWFAIQELESLLEIAGPFRIAYMLGARAGLRRGEIVELRWADVDFDNSRIRVSRAYKRDEHLRWIVGAPKNSRPRTVPIPPDLVDALAKIAGLPDELVAHMPNGERIEPWRLVEAVSRDAMSIGINRPGIASHTLRHTYCSHLAQNGCPAVVIQRLAGHASVRTTERYMHLAPAHLDQGVNYLPALGYRQGSRQRPPTLRLV
jgi:integrase